MVRRALPVVLVLLAAACTPKVPPANAAPVPRKAKARGAPHWREATTPHFILRSDGDEDEVRRLAQDFERFRLVLRSAMAENVDVAEPEVPVTVYAVRDRDEFHELAPDLFEIHQNELLGVTWNAPLGFQVALIFEAPDALRYDSAQHTIRHEYHHVYFDRTSGAWAPLWLREGLAEIWAPGSPDGKSTEIGRIDPRAVAIFRARHDLLPLHELMKVDNRSSIYNSHDRAHVFYLESTLLVHFLLFEEPDGETKLRRFGAALLAGSSSWEAATKVWGDMDELEKRFRSYALERRSYTFAKGHLDSEPPLSIEFRDMTPAEYMAIRADLRLNGPHLNLAKQGFEAALAREPDLGLALEGMGEVARRSHQNGDAHAWFAKAAERPGARFSAFWGLARTSAKGAGQGEVMKSLDRTLELAPRFAPAIAARAALIVDEQPEDAVRLVTSAMALEPNDPMFELRAARILRAAGKSGDAKAHAERGAIRSLGLPRADAIEEICARGTQAGFVTEVALACDRVVELAPFSYPVRLTRAINRTLRRDYEGATADLRDALELCPPAEEKQLRSMIGAVEALKQHPPRTPPTGEPPGADPFW